MQKVLINKEYLKKISKLQNLNKAYYEKNSPDVTDKEFDLLKNEILDLEKKI